MFERSLTIESERRRGQFFCPRARVACCEMTAWARRRNPLGSCRQDRGLRHGHERPDQDGIVAAPFGLTGHPLRARVLGEIHSRPFQLTETPRTILQLAFTVEGGDFSAHVRSLAQVLETHGAPPLAPDARHVSLDLGGGRLRWERYTEFSSWTFDAPATGAAGRAAPGPSVRRRAFSRPGRSSRRRGSISCRRTRPTSSPPSSIRPASAIPRWTAASPRRPPTSARMPTASPASW